MIGSEAGTVVARAVADARAGVSGFQNMAIAALVVMPFTLTATVLLSWMLPLPSLLLQLVWLAVTAVAAAWNAGWRARTSA